MYVAIVAIYFCHIYTQKREIDINRDRGRDWNSSCGKSWRACLVSESLTMMKGAACNLIKRCGLGWGIFDLGAPTRTCKAKKMNNTVAGDCQSRCGSGALLPSSSIIFLIRSFGNAAGDLAGRAAKARARIKVALWRECSSLVHLGEDVVVISHFVAQSAKEPPFLIVPPQWNAGMHRRYARSWRHICSCVDWQPSPQELLA